MHNSVEHIYFLQKNYKIRGREIKIVNKDENQKKTGARMQENIRRLCGSSVGGEGEGPGGGVVDSVLVTQPHQDPPQRRDDRARWSIEKIFFFLNQGLWIRIYLSCWIRIRIQNADPHPGGQK
jgi:hypothetical protein